MLFSDKFETTKDEELIHQFQASHDNRFVGLLYERYGHLVLGLCLKYLKNKDEARDMVIQIFEKLLTDLKKHKIDTFKSWLFVYSKNCCLMALRRRQSQLKKELELQENAVIFMEQEAALHLKEKEEQIRMMETALEQLNTDQKRCLEFFYFQNKSYMEISVLTGYSLNDIKSHIQNGKRNLKIKMASQQKNEE